MIEFLQRFWSERAPRERLILGLGIAMLAVAIAYLVLVEPAATGITRLERALPQQRTQAAELDTLLTDVRQLKARAQVARVAPSETRAAIDQSLARAGLKAARIVPLSDGDLQLTFADVPYSAFAPWLATIERELGARTTVVTVTAKPTAGNVDVDLALRIGGKQGG